MTILDQIMHDSDAAPGEPPPSDLKRLVSLAESLLEQQRVVADLEAQLAEAKAVADRIEQVDIPNLAREIGVEEFKMSNGAKVSINKDIRCSIPVASRGAAYAWLRENGFGGIIKAQVGVAIPLSAIPVSDDIRHAVQNVAEAYNVSYVEQEKVEPQTLKAFLKERIAAETPIDYEMFGVHEYYKAKITAPKTKSSKG